jgi:pimeloyl-ACP methyl ester carboxylesterase
MSRPGTESPLTRRRRAPVLLAVLTLLVAVLVSAGSADAAPMSEVKHVQVGDLSVGDRTGGSGAARPLVMIMGHGGTMFEWDPELLDAVSDARPIVVFDNRGVATTSGPIDGMTIETMADDTAGLIEALDGDRDARVASDVPKVLLLEQVGRDDLFAVEADPDAGHLR